MKDGVDERAQPLLTVSGLSKDYRVKSVERRVLSDVSLTLEKGRVLGIVGESGSGKSTLGRIVGGFLKPTEGEVHVNEGGRDGHSGVQMIFQESTGALNPRLPIWKSMVEALAGSGRLRASQRDEAMTYIEYVGLSTADALRRPGQLSGGQRQRVSIARALAARPALLVCDEAVSSLDVSVRATVLNLLNQVREEFKIGMLFISHDIAIVSHMADDVLVLSGGEVMDYGRTSEVLQTPTSAYTRSLIAATPSLERNLFVGGAA